MEIKSAKMEMKMLKKEEMMEKKHNNYTLGDDKKFSRLRLALAGDLFYDVFIIQPFNLFSSFICV